MSSFVSLHSFPWPLPPAETTLPHWTGSSFQFSSGEKSYVLEYAETESQWSDALTLLHEAEAGNGSHPIDVASRRLAIETFQKYLSQKNNIILDVGCSSGFLLNDIRSDLPFCHVIGADYIAGPLKRLGQQIEEIPLLQFDLRHSPLPDACLDAISCINVLEHIDDDISALKEIYRMLKPGGIAHIEVPAVPSCYDIYDEHLMHHRRYKMAELSKTVCNLKFKILKKTHLGFFVFPAFYIIKKKNQKLLSLPLEIKQKEVKKIMNQTSSSSLMKAVMKIEVLLGRLFSFPIGIRCIMVLKK